MRVVVAGGHGKVALRLERLLAERGDEVVGLVRDPAHRDDLLAVGAVPVVHDLEATQAGALAGDLAGADAVVFAAGAGPGSGPERKRTVDFGAAAKLIDACRRAEVKRYVMVSSIGAHDPAGGPESMRPYLQAKADADEALAASGLDWTIVRPGSLTDDDGNGAVTITDDMSVRGDIPRSDVARVVAACLGNPRSIGKTFVAVGGETLVDQAIDAL